MADETQFLTAKTETTGDSQYRGVSVRAWLAVIIVATVCLISIGAAIAGKEVTVAEPLYGMAMLTLGFYFGQKKT